VKLTVASASRLAGPQVTPSELREAGRNSERPVHATRPPRFPHVYVPPRSPSMAVFWARRRGSTPRSARAHSPSVLPAFMRIDAAEGHWGVARVFEKGAVHLPTGKCIVAHAVLPV
jgi:hypothetical protein